MTRNQIVISPMQMKPERRPDMKRKPHALMFFVLAFLIFSGFGEPRGCGPHYTHLETGKYALVSWTRTTKDGTENVYPDECTFTVNDNNTFFLYQTPYGRDNAEIADIEGRLWDYRSEERDGDFYLVLLQPEQYYDYATKTWVDVIPINLVPWYEYPYAFDGKIFVLTMSHTFTTAGTITHEITFKKEPR